MNEQLSIVDLISIIGVLIGYINLIENRQQSADNDVSKANQEQAQYLLEELTKQFDAIENKLDGILEVLNGRTGDIL